MMSRSRSQSSQRKKDLWKTSIAHAIMQFSQKEGYLSPLLLSLGLFVHQTTRSRVLIDILYSLGYSVSYTEVMNFERNAAVSNATYDNCNNEQESQDMFLQFIADNFDHNEDTKTGGNTTHVMGIISCQTPKVEQTNLPTIQRTKISSTDMLDRLTLGNLIKPYKKLNASKFRYVKLKTRLSMDFDLTKYQRIDTFWLISGLFLEKPPNWQGFMASIVHGNPISSHISYHPIIPLNPSSYEAVYSTLSFVNNEIKKQRICCTSLTFDQPLYWKASEIKEDKSPEFDKIHLKLGGFHQLMSFMGAGCKLMEDAGLLQLWSTVYKENSIPKMLEGKAYSRCLRACLLTDSALHYMLLQQKEDTNTTNTKSAHQVLDTFDEHDELYRRGAVVNGVEHSTNGNVFRVPSVGRDLNLQKLNYQHLTTSVAVISCPLFNGLLNVVRVVNVCPVHAVDLN